MHDHPTEFLSPAAQRQQRQQDPIELLTPDRGRRKSFIARLGLSPRRSLEGLPRSTAHATVCADETVSPLQPVKPLYIVKRNASDSTVKSRGKGIAANTAAASQRKHPTPSSPRLLAAFGHSYGFGPGQHVSHYPMSVISALTEAGVPLPSIADVGSSATHIAVVACDDQPQQETESRHGVDIVDCLPTSQSLSQEAQEATEDVSLVIPTLDEQESPSDTACAQTAHRQRRHSLASVDAQAELASLASSSEFSLSAVVQVPDQRVEVVPNPDTCHTSSLLLTGVDDDKETGDGGIRRRAPARSPRRLCAHEAPPSSVQCLFSLSDGISRHAAEPIVPLPSSKRLSHSQTSVRRKDGSAFRLAKQTRGSPPPGRRKRHVIPPSPVVHELGRLRMAESATAVHDHYADGLHDDPNKSVSDARRQASRAEDGALSLGAETVDVNIRLSHGRPLDILAPARWSGPQASCALNAPKGGVKHAADTLAPPLTLTADRAWPRILARHSPCTLDQHAPPDDRMIGQLESASGGAQGRASPARQSSDFEMHAGRAAVHMCSPQEAGFAALESGEAISDAQAEARPADGHDETCLRSAHPILEHAHSGTVLRTAQACSRCRCADERQTARQIDVHAQMRNANKQKISPFSRNHAKPNVNTSTANSSDAHRGDRAELAWAELTCRFSEKWNAVHGHPWSTEVPAEGHTDPFSAALDRRTSTASETRVTSKLVRIEAGALQDSGNGVEARPTQLGSRDCSAEDTREAFGAAGVLASVQTRPKTSSTALVYAGECVLLENESWQIVKGSRHEGGPSQSAGCLERIGWFCLEDRPFRQSQVIEKWCMQQQQQQLRHQQEHQHHNERHLATPTNSRQDPDAAFTHDLTISREGCQTPRSSVPRRRLHDTFGDPALPGHETRLLSSSPLTKHQSSLKERPSNAVELGSTTRTSLRYLSHLPTTSTLASLNTLSTSTSSSSLSSLSCITAATAMAASYTSPLTSVLAGAALDVGAGPSRSTTMSSDLFQSAYGSTDQRSHRLGSSHSRSSSESEQASSSWERETSRDSKSSPREQMMLQKKAQLRISRMLDMTSQSQRSSARQQSFFDSMDADSDFCDEVREAQHIHRSVHSPIGARSDPSFSPISTQSLINDLSESTHSESSTGSSNPFVSDLGCWMEETEDSIGATNVMSIIDEDDVRRVSIEETRPTSGRKAPPRPTRHASRTRLARNTSIMTQDSPSRSDLSHTPSMENVSWSKLRRVPMYTRLAHLPLRLVEAPSSISWRNRIGAAEFERLSSEFDAREMRRQEVIEEFYVTENSFVTSIAGILHTFSEPLRFSDNTFHGDVPIEVARLFHDLDEILAIHVKLFQTMESLAKSHPTALIVSLAEAITPIVKELTIYQSYLIRYESVIKLWQALRTSENKGNLTWFVETMERQEMLPQCMGMTLSSFLLKPVQRLMKYPLFFKQLEQLVDENHPDAAATRELNSTVERLIRNLNTVKAREEDFETLCSLERRIKGLPEGFRLATRQRRLLKQGSVRCVRLTDAERNALSDRSRCEIPVPSAVRSHSPVLSVHPELRRLSLTPSSPANSPRLSICSDQPSQDSGSAFSHDSFAATTPSGSSFTSHSSNASFAMATPYFDLKTPAKDVSPASDAARSPTEETQGKRKSMAGFLLRGSSIHASNTSAEGKASSGQVAAEPTEEEMYVFVFDDVCLLTHKSAPTGAHLLKSNTIKGQVAAKKKSMTAKQAAEEETFTVVRFGGLSRILGVTDLSNGAAASTKALHAHLLELEVMPIKGEGVNNARSGLSCTISFDFAFGSDEAAFNGWHQSFQRCFCCSIYRQSSHSKQRQNATPSSPVVITEQQYQDWYRREKQVTDLLKQSARACDRVNLAAVLQTGLPYPRSPSQQRLADLALRTAAHVDWHGANARDLFKLAEKAEAKSIAKDQAKSRLTNLSNHSFSDAASMTSPVSSLSATKSLRLRSSSSHPNLKAASSLDVETIARVGDAESMRGIPTWIEERNEEREWWAMRLRDIEGEAEREEHITKLVEARKNRHQSSSLAYVPSSQLLEVPSPMAPSYGSQLSNGNAEEAAHSASPARTVRVRRGLPILKITANASVTSLSA